MPYFAKYNYMHIAPTVKKYHFTNDAKLNCRTNIFPAMFCKNSARMIISSCVSTKLQWSFAALNHICHVLKNLMIGYRWYKIHGNSHLQSKMSPKLHEVYSPRTSLPMVNGSSVLFRPFPHSHLICDKFTLTGIVYQN